MRIILVILDIALGVALLVAAPRVARNESSTLRRWFRSERTTMTVMILAGGVFIVLGMLWLVS